MGQVALSSEITSRDYFGDLAEARGYEVGVEVGVDRGEFAVALLERWPKCKTLFCVDPYEPYPEMPWDRSGDFAMAVNRLSRFRAARLVRQDNRKLAQSFAMAGNGPQYPMLVDFVYIDGDHSDAAGIVTDMEFWWSRLTDRGMLAGHDLDPDHSEVIKAVDFFTASRSVEVFITTADLPPSWYIYRTKPASYLSLTLLKETNRCESTE